MFKANFYAELNAGIFAENRRSGKMPVHAASCGNFAAFILAQKSPINNAAAAQYNEGKE